MNMLIRVIGFAMILLMFHQVEGAPLVHQFRRFDLSPFAPSFQPINRPLMYNAVNAPNHFLNPNDYSNPTGKIFVVDNISGPLATLQSSITTLKNSFNGLALNIASAVKNAPAG